jgi:phosphohistidine phosphatase
MTESRQLIIMRHAKAGELPGRPDAERPLRPRGHRNAAAAGRWLTGRGAAPELVLCSRAQRAQQTWQDVSAELAASPQVVSDPRLYEADAPDLVEIFSETGPEVRSLMYVGHNPAAADVTEFFVGRPVDFPTAAIAIIALNGSWSELSPASAAGTGELVASWIPRADAG